MSAHAYLLQLQGQNNQDVDKIATLHQGQANLLPKESALLIYVKALTLEPAQVRDTDVEALRQAGWTDDEIFEASFITSLFAFFNRMADAYGLDYNPARWIPPEMRKDQKEPPKKA